ncbi:MAG: DUF211 domain-containing protein [Desulfobulbaceae bacterium]
MTSIRRIVIDVLKPHHPNSLEFAIAVADRMPGARVEVTVSEMDEKTESVIVVIEGEALDYEAITGAVNDMGGSIHSIDEVLVESGTGEDG